ncbi:50S ribosomal protein L6 [Telmatospirillum siberiense]|uniref:Large ribosomal subunit protein uL6 n=1 Tax=Telmatospirillum siberiense TaxID=382514 RepID=A0A2N3PN86_9PROT|nr:50S ribosomal protein L6 [Telmatospirillum siberiense]PKU21865.1 50S ribosomal protein L6 [Telmatospirillum siberiense]
MSRVGKYPVVVPNGVTVTVSGAEVSVKGKLGVSALQIVDDVETTLDGNHVWVKPKAETKRARMMWGTTRALINNMVKGVSEGFTVNLEINGVGYRAAVQGKVLQLQLGFSHDVNYPIPDDVTIKCEKPTSVSITGKDRQRVGQIAAEIRAYRGPEPYKGKGVKYETETILRKEGKKK